MPRRAPHLVRWSPQKQTYEVSSTELAVLADPIPDSAAWFAWLESVSSFAFQSRSGAHCTARRETIRDSQEPRFKNRGLQ